MADFPQNAETLIDLLSCAVNERKCELKPEAIDLDGLYSLARKQVLCSAVAYALESAGIEDRRFMQAKLKAKRKLSLFDIEREKIYEKLNEAGIRFLPLKGIVLNDFYPRYGMREMSDNDILCDAGEMQKVREIMESLGYTCESFGEWHHDVYQKPPTLEFEMHRSLFMDEDNLQVFERYYVDVFDRAVHKSGCEYAFSNEDFYIYFLAHVYKHFSHNGTGLRSLLDVYVYLRSHPDMDFDYIGRELEKVELTEFEQICRDLAEKLFGDRERGETDSEALTHFLDTTLYGSVEKGEYNSLTRRLNGSDAKSAKAKLLLDMVFLRGDALRKRYPFIAKHKWLLPALYVYRPFRGVFVRPKEVVQETKKVMKYKYKEKK